MEKENGFYLYGYSSNEELVQLNEKPYYDLSCAIVLGLANNINYANAFWLRIDIADETGKVFVSYLKEGF